jgi:hypothetical protein
MSITTSPSFSQKEEYRLAQRWLWLFISLHVLVWTVAPLFIRYTVTADAIESFVWGQSLDWGYDKNPYLAGWIPHFALWLNFHNNAVGYYLIQQLLIGLGFWSIWKLGNLLLSPYRALIAVLIYEGCLYFSAYAQTNNDNFPLVGLWGIAALTFYLACQKQLLKYWLITGFSLGLAMMVKYSTSVFMAGLFLYLLINKDARRSFYQPGLYISALVFLIPVVPNLIWLFHHDFIAFHYVSSRTALGENGHFYTTHLSYIGEFIQKTTVNFLGCVALFLLSVPQLVPKSARERTTTQYLWCISIFPLSLVLGLATLLRWQLYWEWGVPFIIFWGLTLVHYCKPKTDFKVIMRFLIGVLLVMLISLFGNILISCYLQAGKGSADYPAQQIANHVTQTWHQHYHRPLLFVAGSRYTAGYVAFYAQQKPKVFAEWDELLSPGVSEAIIRKNGAVFVQDSSTAVPPQFPSAIMQKYPQLIILPIRKFSYHRNEKTGETVQLLIAILPPAS